MRKMRKPRTVLPGVKHNARILTSFELKTLVRSCTGVPAVVQTTNDVRYCIVVQTLLGKYDISNCVIEPDRTADRTDDYL